ncbi:DUF6544 family protein [Mucilaginibacter sp. OK098]|uniref:DUF6544 family protein n=1 Tax=Mucilaginibacter sp. OK098 TaxID=1855297 RepID=UPI000911DEFB|nr:DUF6544 family protein [Mucilaginibacter sp. OK098]SHN14019.1 hypothetical protein SAMN05216524_105580 [Mucilaginibacter sp. OK098]
MVILFIITGILVIIFLKRVRLSHQFNNEVKELFALSNSVSHKKFSYRQLVGLPEPVQRYFKHILTEGQPYINYARLIHTGQFKAGPDKKWASIKGEQYFTMEKPGFIWKGKTWMFTARDMYIRGKGRLIVSLFSLYNIVNAEGEKISQGELLRWLAENVWFPTNLLPGKNLGWTAIDTHTAKLTFNHNELSCCYIVTFNNKGEITQFETKRYMGEESLETWVGKLGNYKEMNGIMVPTSIEAIWKLPKGDFSYAKFNVIKIEYDIPRKFDNKQLVL